MNLNKKLVNKEDLLRDVDDVDIYSTYAPGIEIAIGKPILSPLREESSPSFGFFIGEGSEVLFNDFKLGGGDCIKFVQILFGYTFFEAMSRIVIDFDLTDKYYHKELDTKSPIKATKSLIDRNNLLKKAGSSLLRKRRRAWKQYDIDYWASYGINIKTLKKYKVEPVSHIFINEKIISCDKYAYCFKEHKDGAETYKIYQPFNKDFKWLNNHDDSVWQGWEQLPEKGDILIITKSLKDVMTINCLTGYPAISLQAESVKPKQHIIEELKERFQCIFIWYDNDYDKETNWGMQFGRALAAEFDLIHTYIPSAYSIKDPSDFAKIKGRREAKELIETLTSVPF
jgi:hypothetical protein